MLIKSLAVVTLLASINPAQSRIPFGHKNITKAAFSENQEFQECLSDCKSRSNQCSNAAGTMFRQGIYNNKEWGDEFNRCDTYYNQCFKDCRGRAEEKDLDSLWSVCKIYNGPIPQNTVLSLIRACDSLLEHGMSDRAKFAEASIYQGLGYMRLHRNSEAIQALSNALSSNPEAKIVYYYRSFPYDELGKFDEALDDVNEFLKVRQADRAGLAMRCRIKAHAGRDLAGAFADCNRAIANGRTSAVGDRAWVYLRMGELSKALADFNEANQLIPDAALELYGRALVEHRLREENLSRADFSRALQIDPMTDQIVKNWKY
jgi:tetratricopeptide (TPR) repeat protein